ncbi:DUF2058 domain-containing protein [Marinimicrobium sp. C2-29]|uniref:DUF2058 domain-containing protein n=1 Tax=Marinimicrobium sp. C2-29 TaxID=3139825 RepID=UPI00313953F3
MPSLQDQLQKAGLVDDKKAKQVKKEQRKQKKQARHTGEDPHAEIRQSAQAAKEQKAERDRALNRQREEEAQQRAIAAQIKQLIETHRQAKLASGEGEVEYNFTDGKTIKKMVVTPRVHQQISRGQLVIVRSGERYELVPRVVADKIAQRDEQALIVANSKPSDEPDEDDPYKDYVIPDDLMW